MTIDDPATDDPVREAGMLMDRSLHAAVAKATQGLSPSSLAGAYLDWIAHLAGSPGSQMWLAWKGARKALRYTQYLAQCAQHGGEFHGHLLAARVPRDVKSFSSRRGNFRQINRYPAQFHTGRYALDQAPQNHQKGGK